MEGDPTTPQGDAWADANARAWGQGANEPAMRSELAVVAELRWGEAWMLAGRLSDEGIEARVWPDYQVGAFGLTRVPAWNYQVLVPAKQLESAPLVAKAVEEGRTSI
jgi:hypothetical protein